MALSLDRRHGLANRPQVHFVRRLVGALVIDEVAINSVAAWLTTLTTAAHDVAASPWSVLSGNRRTSG